MKTHVIFKTYSFLIKLVHSSLIYAHEAIYISWVCVVAMPHDHALRHILSKLWGQGHTLVAWSTMNFDSCYKLGLDLLSYWLSRIKVIEKVLMQVVPQNALYKQPLLWTAPKNVIKYDYVIQKLLPYLAK